MLDNPRTAVDKVVFDKNRNRSAEKGEKGNNNDISSNAKKKNILPDISSLISSSISICSSSSKKPSISASDIRPSTATFQLKIKGIFHNAHHRHLCVQFDYANVGWHILLSAHHLGKENCCIWHWFTMSVEYSEKSSAWVVRQFQQLCVRIFHVLKSGVFISFRNSSLYTTYSPPLHRRRAYRS